jgi:hypothetical protein
MIMLYPTNSHVTMFARLPSIQSLLRKCGTGTCNALPSWANGP